LASTIVVSINGAIWSANSRHSDSVEVNRGTSGAQAGRRLALRAIEGFEGWGKKALDGAAAARVGRPRSWRVRADRGVARFCS